MHSVRTIVKQHSGFTPPRGGEEDSRYSEYVQRKIDEAYEFSVRRARERAQALNEGTKPATDI